MEQHDLVVHMTTNSVTCARCHMKSTLICSSCLHESPAKSLLEEFRQTERLRRKFLALHALIEQQQSGNADLMQEIEARQAALETRKSRLASDTLTATSAERRVSQRFASLDSLPLLHPLRKFESVRNALTEERRKKCAEFFALFPGAENLLDLNTEDQVISVLEEFARHVIRGWSFILDTPMLHRGSCVVEDAKFLVHFAGGSWDHRTDVLDALGKSLESFGSEAPSILPLPTGNLPVGFLIKDERIQGEEPLRLGTEWTFLDR